MTLNRQALRIRIAADARLTPTTYTNDQIWELVTAAAPDEPAIKLQTRYGGRVGLARLVFSVRHKGRSILDHSAWATPPTLTQFTPNSLRLVGQPIEGVTLTLHLWAMDSQHVGGRIDLENESGAPQSLDMGFYLQAMQHDKALPIHALDLATPAGQAAALNIHGLAGLSPVLLLEDGTSSGGGRLGRARSLGEGEKDYTHFVLSSLAERDQSVSGAYTWLHEADWKAHLTAIHALNAAAPVFVTGDDATDAALALTIQTLYRSLMGATDVLPQPSLVFTRVPSMGYSAAPDGSGHQIGWQGAAALDVFVATAALAVLDAKLAAGVVRNYIAMQEADGFIDSAIGAGGQKRGELLLPMLAQLTELIYAVGQDDKFLQSVLPGLAKFYRRWMDEDTDGDGFPEWSSVSQACFPQHPTFGAMGAGADIRTIESPDLMAYLLNEGDALKRLAGAVGSKGDKVVATVEKHQAKLAAALQKSWHNGQFVYRDRASDAAIVGQTLFSGHGEQAPTESYTISPPNRLMIHVEGGLNHQPTVSATIVGLDAEGQPAEERLGTDAFRWYRVDGHATSRTVWSRIDKVTLTGLSRVYDYTLKTLDLSRQDLTLLLPLTTDHISDTQRESLNPLLGKLYWQEYGLSILPNDDPNFALPDGIGRQVVPAWMLMFGLALLRSGDVEASLDLFEALTTAQTKALVEQGAFYSWYDAVSGAGLGMPDTVSGSLSLVWLAYLSGFVVQDAGHVAILGGYHLPRSIKVKWHGVKVVRKGGRLKIEFPSGHVIEQVETNQAQIISDPNYVQEGGASVPAAPAGLGEIGKPPPQRVNVPLSQPTEPDDDEPLFASPD